MFRVSYRVHFAKKVVNEWGGAVYYGQPEERLEAQTLKTALKEFKNWKERNKDAENPKLLEVREVDTKTG